MRERERGGSGPPRRGCKQQIHKHNDGRRGTLTRRVVFELRLVQHPREQHVPQCCAVCVCRGERSGAGLRLHHLNRGRERKPKRGSRRTTRRVWSAGATGQGSEASRAKSITGCSLLWETLGSSALVARRHQACRRIAAEEQRHAPPGSIHSWGRARWARYDSSTAHLPI